MAKGAWVQPDVKLEIAKVYNELKDKGDIPTAKEVRAELEKRLRSQNKEQFLVSLRTVQLIITGIHKNEPKPETPWSVGVSVREGIPEDAIGDIIKIWQWSVTIGHEFTVREARWIARLRNAFPRSNDEELRQLHCCAAMYAGRERAKETLKQTDFESAFLDLCFFYNGLRNLIVFKPKEMSRKDLNLYKFWPADDDAFVEYAPNRSILLHVKILLPQRYLWFADTVKAIESRLGLTVKHAKKMSNEKKSLEYCNRMRLAELYSWDKETLEEKSAEAQRLYDEIVAEGDKQ